MPVIAGLVSPELSTHLPVQLEAMARRLRRDPFQPGEQRVAGRAALLGIGRAEERVLSVREGVWLALAGDNVQQDELARQLRYAGRRTDGIRTPSDLVLELFLAFGPRCVAQLNGSYALAIWEEDQQRLTLVRDRLGSANLYIWQDGPRLAFGSEYRGFAALPGFPTAVDEAAVADLISYHQVMAGRTFFRAVRMLPPGSQLVWQDGRSTIESHWQWMDAWGSAGGARTDLVDAFAGHLHEAVRRRLQPNTALLLTGGLDSRSIAGMAKKADPTLALQTVTVGPEHATDVRIAAQIAAELGYAHTRLPLQDDYLALYAARAAWRAEGKLNAYAAWIYAAEAYLRRQGIRHVLTGVIGNPVSGRHYPAEFAMLINRAQVVKMLEVVKHARR
jgi:asparagine synthase (glutamine-hydrolysing)